MSKPKRKPDIDFTLRRVFGKQNFRPYQREIITATLDGYDVFVQAATSFGKSLCYQLPAVIDHGITIVISPLLALMEDQVTALRAANLEVATINSKTPTSTRNAIMEDLRCGHPRTRLLYVTPEFCLLESFRKHLKAVYDQRELARIAIDEAHCISEWGHDFRPAYSHLSYFRTTYPSTPIICLTATSTLAVRTDIISTLALNPQRLKVFTTSTSRSNLHYEIRFTSDSNDTRFTTFTSWLSAVHSRRSTSPTRRAELNALNERPDAVTGIIYTSYRSECDNIASRLRTVGFGAAAYHAGLSAQERLDVQSKWLANTLGYDVIVATTAFGMGIDKENVRFVVHWCMPKSFEGFYQEAGRAGRDGKASLCILYYSREDRDRAAYRISKDVAGVGNGSGNNAGRNITEGKQAQMEGRAKSFQKLVEYCENVEKCRHKMISEYFGEVEAPECDFACDVCKDKMGLRKRKEEGLASEEWVSTQRERGSFYGDGYDD